MTVVPSHGGDLATDSEFEPPACKTELQRPRNVKKDPAVRTTAIAYSQIPRSRETHADVGSGRAHE